MDGLSSWVKDNWFNVIQTVGVVGSLLLAAAAARRGAKAREIENLLTITENHRNLWNEAHQRDDLARIFQTDIDALKNPATVAETVTMLSSPPAEAAFVCTWRSAVRNDRR